MIKCLTEELSESDSDEGSNSVGPQLPSMACRGPGPSMVGPQRPSGPSIVGPQRPPGPSSVGPQRPPVASNIGPQMPPGFVLKYVLVPI